MKISVFIATSLDGFIADSVGNIDFLHSFPNPDGNDLGYSNFMKNVDAILMGRTTFEVVCSFDMDWPYHVPVFVLSNSMSQLPAKTRGKAHILNGDLKKVTHDILKKGYQNLYIDGGKTIQSFLKEDLIDELIITTIPVLLGGGIPLFGELNKPMDFKCENSTIYLNSIVQNKFIRNRI